MRSSDPGAPLAETRPPPLSAMRGRRRGPSGVRSTRRSRGAPTAPTGTGYADEYQATHGEFLGDAGFVWGPEGLTEDEAGVLGDVAGRDVLEVGSRRRPVLPLGARARRPRRRPRPVGAPAPALPPHRRRDRHRRARRCAATATALPFADATFDVVFCSFGALQFVADLDVAVAEVARVLRPGGRFAFSITHPTRWMLPRRPVGGGADRRRRRTGTARRTSRWTTRPAGRLRRAPPHARRLGGAAAPAPASGSSRCSSRSGPSDHDRVWGGWSRVRGRLTPAPRSSARRSRPADPHPQWSRLPFTTATTLPTCARGRRHAQQEGRRPWSAPRLFVLLCRAAGDRPGAAPAEAPRRGAQEAAGPRGRGSSCARPGRRHPG